MQDVTSFVFYHLFIHKLKRKVFIMKKFFMTLAAMAMTVCASAQVYVGGNVGIASVDIEDVDDSRTVYSFLPEIGYKFNDTWAAGVSFGWSKGGLYSTKGSLNTSEPENVALDNMTHTFEINPYARFNVFKSKVINLFIDGGVGYKHYNGQGDDFSIGLKPGVELKLNKFSLLAHVGFLGYTKSDPEDGLSTDVWGLDLDGNNIQLGVLYNF